MEATNTIVSEKLPDDKMFTSEEKNSTSSHKLRAGPVPLPAWLIIITELCERSAFYGATLLFVPYLTKTLGQSTAAATAINRTFQFFAYFTTIVGAVIADIWLGKFKTILLFASVYFVGLLFLSLTSIKPSLQSGFALPGFCISIFLFVAWGTGGIKSNVSAFAAEQVNQNSTLNKSATNYDYNLTVERVFRYFYWAINLGSLVGQIICPIIYHNADSPTLAFAFPAMVFAIGIVVFAMGRSKYTKFEKKKNPLTKVYRCCKYALKNKKKSTQAQKSHWLDASKVENSDWDIKYVDDLKRSLNACKVFLFYIVYWALYNNMTDAFIIQGLTLKKPDWVPGAEQLNIFNSLALVICIPIFDFCVFPVLRKFGFKLGPISRITIGFVICTITFIYVTVLQKIIYSTGPYYNFTGADIPKDAFNNISLWYQIPPYALIAISEIFSSATGLEYAFKFATPELKSIILALFLLTNCGGSLIGLFLAIWSYHPHYLTLFAVQSAVMGIMAIIFYILFRKQDDQV